MPPNMQIGLLVLGGVLVLMHQVALLEATLRFLGLRQQKKFPILFYDSSRIAGGNIKIFGAEAAEKVSNPFLRFIAFAFGAGLIFVSVHPQNPTPENKIFVDPGLSSPNPIPGVSIKKNNSIEVIPARDFQWACKGNATINAYTWVGPGGDSSFRSDERNMLPSAPFCSLIGRVGTGAWHYLGDNNTFTADSSGSLYLTANDVTPGNCPLPNKQECYSDNKGTASATVTVNVRN